MSALLSATDLTKVYGTAAKRALRLLDEGQAPAAVLAETRCSVAVHGVDFEVRAGELFVIMGLSGSGKSTVLRMLNGLVEPTRGSIALAGRDLGRLSAPDLRVVRNRQLGMVFQHCAIFPHRTVLENVAYGLGIRGMPRAERLARARETLAKVGLAGREDSYPAGLSGGMRQRVGIARALACEPQVLLMDEPFSALDPLNRRDMQDLLLGLHRDLGTTIVFVTHDLNEAMRLGDRVMVMREGTIAQIGTVAEILGTPANDYVARFVADVDRTRVLVAGDLVAGQSRGRAGTPFHAPPNAPRIGAGVPLVEVCARLGAHDGPIIVVDEGGRPVGLVSAREALAAVGASASLDAAGASQAPGEGRRRD